MDVRFHVISEGIEFRGVSRYIRVFPGLELVRSRVFQAICTENHTSIHPNLTGADNSRSNEIFFGLFPGAFGQFANFPKVL